MLDNMAALDSGVLISELNKLKKQELIEVMVNNILPVNVTSRVILEFVKKNKKCEVCCENLNIATFSYDSSDTVIGKVNMGNVEVKYLKELCEQKDLLIKSQQLTVEALLEQITLMRKATLDNNEIPKPIIEVPSTGIPNKFRHLDTPAEKGSINPCKLASSGSQHQKAQHKTQPRITTRKSSHKNENFERTHKGRQPINHNDKISQPQMSKAVMEALQKQTMQDLIDVNVNKNESEWNSMSYGRKRHNKLTVVGTGTLSTGSNSCKLKAVPILTYFHVYQLDPGTTDTDMLSYLKSLFPEVTCDKLESRYSDRYASFKVGVQAQNTDSLTQPNIWPEGTKIRKFFHLRRRPLKPS